MNTPDGLPTGLVHVRTTPQFDADTVPSGLLDVHQLASGRWGRLVVGSGTLTLVFDDDVAAPVTLDAGGSWVIPPERRHHVELEPGASFALEIHRAPDPASD